MQKDKQLCLVNEEVLRRKTIVEEAFFKNGLVFEKIKTFVSSSLILFYIVPPLATRSSFISRCIVMGMAELAHIEGWRVVKLIPHLGSFAIEVPRERPESVFFSSLMTEVRYKKTKVELPLLLGQTAKGESYVADFSKIPHLLIVGDEGQGKRNLIKGIVYSLLYKKQSNQLNFIFIDTQNRFTEEVKLLKTFGFFDYFGASNSATSDYGDAAGFIRHLNVEMEKRYEVLRDSKSRNIQEYNRESANFENEHSKSVGFLPYLVVIIDDVADLTLAMGGDTQLDLARLSQLSRAVGIHIILSSAKPSKSALPEMILCNFPTKACFSLSTKQGYRSYLKLSESKFLFQPGDMIFDTGERNLRLQAPLVTNDDCEKLYEVMKHQEKDEIEVI